MIKNTIQKPLFVFIFVLLVSSCTSFHRPKEIEIDLIQTTDVHGSIFPYDFIRDKPVNHSLAQVSTLINEYRSDHRKEVVLLDNGDILQGQPPVYYSNYEEVNLPHICSKVMNYMGYDAATVGNHDIEAGHSVYDKLISEFRFPWLAANAVLTGTKTPYFKPYTVIKRKGIKIAVLGLITPGIPNWLPENLWKGIEFLDMVESAKLWVPKIMEKEDPDLLIGLFHSGHDYSYGGGSASEKRNENASLLVAQQVPGFDVILIGHDHDEFNQWITGKDSSKVLILDPGSHARNIALVQIHLSWNKETKEYNKQIEGSLVPIANVKVDTSFMKEFEPDFKTFKDYVSRKVGVFEKTITSVPAFFGDRPFMDLIHRVQLEVSKADISFAAPLSMRSEIDSADVYVRDLFELYRFENFLYTMELSGKEIKNYLEYSCDLWFNRMKNSSDHLLRFKKDDHGKLMKYNRTPVYRLFARYYNFDSAEGIRYEVDVTRPKGQRVHILSMSDGTPFHPDNNYKVALNSYRGNGGGGHLTEGAGVPHDKLSSRILSSTDKDFRYYMLRWIENEGRVDPVCNNNWKVVPVRWWKKGKKKDIELLF